MIRHDYKEIFQRLEGEHPMAAMLEEWKKDFPEEEGEEMYYNFIWDKYIDGTLEADEIWPNESL